MFSNYLLLFLLTIIFLEIFFILIQTVKNKFSCHVLSENAILIAPNAANQPSGLPRRLHLPCWASFRMP